MRSRLSSEMERELGSNGSPLMTPRNVTPPPLRSLKWKSSTEEDKEQEKRPELSGLGMQDHAKNALQEEVLSDAVVVMTGCEEEEAGEVAKLQQHVELSGGLGLVDQTKLVGDLSLKGQLGTEQIGGGDSPGHGHERKSSSGEDAMTMTIEFLRARLLAERAASRAAKQQVQQLNKQIIELERKLEQTVDERLKAERAAEQALAELKTAGTLAVEQFGAVVLDGNQGRAAAPPQAQESSLVQPMPNVMSAEEEKKLEQDGTGDDKESIKVNLTQQDTNAANDSTANLHASVAANGCTTDVTVLDKWPTDPQNMLETLNGSTQSQDQSRVAIEDRLRKMWSQISEEINALTEERSEEDHGCAELVSWMCQVSAVLQEILPTTMGPHGQSTQLGTNENRHIVGGLAIESSQAQNAKMDAESKVGLTALVNEYEAQESVQREWEKNYYDAQQTLEQNSQNLQDEEVSAGGGGIGTHPSHLKSSVLVGQEDNRSHDEGLIMRSSDDAYERAAQPEHRVLTTAAEKEDAPGEGLRRGQRQVLVDTGTHHLQDAHNEANLLSSQIMLRGQKEGTARGLQAQEISGQQHHSRSYSEGSSRWAGDGKFEIPRQSLDYGAGVERQEIDHTAYPRALTAQLSRFVNTDHGLQKDLQQYQELVDNEGANVWHRDTSQSVQGNYVAEKQYQQLQSRHLGAESVDKNSGFLNGELQLSLGYGPSYDAPPPPKEPLAAEQPSMELSTSRNASDILQALQRLKQNIQGSSSSEKIPNIRSGGDPSPFSRAGYEGSSPPVKYLHQASAPSLHQRLTHNSQQQHQLQHRSTYPQPYYQHKQQGAYSRSPGTLQSLDSPSDSRLMTYNSDYCYPYSQAFVDEENTMGSSSRHHYPQNSKLDIIPVTKNGHSSYADKLNVGTGIRFFFP